jgi:Arc/MetJ-type ribon-helix-helix transcriptional regulator
MTEANKFTTISIPTPLADKIKKQIKDTGFTSLSSYVTYILREVLSTGEEKDEVLSKEDKEKIKNKLRSLGYLD